MGIAASFGSFRRRMAGGFGPFDDQREALLRQAESLQCTDKAAARQADSGSLD